MEIRGWLHVEIQSGLKFQPGLRIKKLEKRSSRLHEESFIPVWNFSPVWAYQVKKSLVIARKNFSSGWKDDLQAWEDANCLNNKGYQQIPAKVPISVLVRAEIFHVIGTFFNPYCRAEIFPCNQPLIIKLSGQIIELSSRIPDSGKESAV